MSERLFTKLSWIAGCFAIFFLFGLIALAANIEIKDVDLWLHLAAGKYITQSFSIPKFDFLSATVANIPWINHEWLFQTIVYSIYNTAGVDGLISLRVSIVVLTFLLLFFLGYTREYKIAPIVVLLLVLLVYQMRLTLRPDILSLLFFVLYIIILGVHLDKRWSWGVIALIQIVWTNAHGFFILGPICVLVSLAGEWMKRHCPLPLEWNTVGRLSDREYRQLKKIFVIVMCSCLVNPYFVKGALYPFSVLFSIAGESRIFFQYIQELQRPLQWSTLFSLQSYFYYKLLIGISFFSFVFNRRKIDISVLMLWFVFLLFSLSASRNIVFFAFAAYLAFLANFEHISIRKFLPIQFNNVKFKAFCSVVLKIIFIVWVANYGNRLLLRGYYDFDTFERKSEYGGVSLRNYPYKAADFLVANNIKGNFFNDFNSGAYLLGRASPDVKVFIDGRTEVYGAKFYDKYRKIWEGDKELFREAADQYKLTGAFLNSVYVPAPAKMIRHLYENEEWVLVYFDYDASIFLRDIEENHRWINRYQMNLARWQTPKADLLKIGTRKVTPYRHVNRAYALFNMGFDQKAHNEALEALRIEPYNAKAHKLLGRIFNERGEFLSAFEHLRKAKLLAPDDMNVRYQMGLALYHLGEIEQAKRECQLVLARKPKSREGLFLLALIYTKEQKYNEMLDVLQEVRQSISGEVSGFLKVGDLLFEQNENVWAKVIYTMALEIDPANEKAKNQLSAIP